MECPSCTQELNNDAKYCGCGWSQNKAAQSRDGLSYEERMRLAHQAMEARILSYRQLPPLKGGRRDWCSPENLINQYQVDHMLRNRQHCEREIRAAEEAGVIVNGRYVEPSRRLAPTVVQHVEYTEEYEQA